MLRGVVETHCRRAEGEYEAPPQCGGSARDYFAARAQFDLVAECAVGSLAEHRCTDDLPLLFDAIRRGDPIVRQKAAESLAYQFPADESVRDVLCAQYELEPGGMKTILFGLINEMDRIAALGSKEA